MKDNLSKKLRESGVHKGTNNSRATKIFCVETLKIYDLISDAAKDYGVTIGAINHALRDPSFVCCGHHFLLYDDDLYQKITDTKEEYIRSCYKNKPRPHLWFYNHSTGEIMTKTDIFNELKGNCGMTTRELNRALTETITINDVQYELLN